MRRDCVGSSAHRAILYQNGMTGSQLRLSTIRNATAWYAAGLSAQAGGKGPVASAQEDSSVGGRMSVSQPCHEESGRAGDHHNQNISKTFLITRSLPCNLSVLYRDGGDIAGSNVVREKQPEPVRTNPSSAHCRSCRVAFQL